MFAIQIPTAVERGKLKFVIFSRYGLTPQAKIIGFQDSAQDPVDWPTSPAIGMNQLLRRLNLTKDDISLWEINEAFAMVVLANAQILGLDLVIQFASTYCSLNILL